MMSCWITHSEVHVIVMWRSFRIDKSDAEAIRNALMVHFSEEYTNTTH